MLRTTSPTSSLTISQLLIDAVDEDEVGRIESGGDEINLSNPSASKRSIRTDYLTLQDTKKGNGNTNKGVKAATGSHYLISNTKKALNYLQHAFKQAFIF